MCTSLERKKKEEVGRCVFPPTKLCDRFTFIQHGAEDGQVVLDGGAVPPPAPELVLAFLNAQLDALGDAGHDLDVVAAEAQLLGHQAGDGAAEDGLGAQGRVLLPEGQGPETHPKQGDNK